MSPSEIVEKIGVRNGYLFAFVLALTGGVSMFTTLSFHATIVEAHQVLLRLRYSSKPRDDVTQLYNHNANVDAINTKELAKLSGTAKVFEMHGRGPEKLVATLKRGCLSPEILSLKTGARVMFAKNDVTAHR